MPHSSKTCWLRSYGIILSHSSADEWATKAPLVRRSAIRIPKSAFILVLSFVASLAAGTQAPERKVESNAVKSACDPKVRIELPRSVRYVGAERWVLYGIVDCELHAFVEADGQPKVERLYWVQFESYLPTRPDLHHRYDSPRHITIGGLDFYVDIWASGKDEKTTLAPISNTFGR